MSSAGPSRCIVYATPNHSLGAFARAVIRAGRSWKPVAVPPLALDAAVRALQPEAVIVAAHQPRAATLLRQTRKRYSDRLVIDDGNLKALTKLLSAA